MDFEVHRLRIGNWKPEAIKTIACDDQFSHNLAIGKENGEIEIVDPVDNFAMLLRVTGRDDFRLQALTWSKFISEHGRNRLFGISLKGFLFEVDLNEGKIVHVTDSFSSAVWAVQSSPRSDTLAVGCEDGAVRLFEFGHHRRAPDYLKSLTTAGARVLCLAYHQTLPKLVIGSADGVVRVLDETSGRVLQRLSATTPVGQTCCIWSLALLSDETIVTGDSNGRVLVWDGQRGVATHCFTQHSADVLALVASRDETQLFAAGVDGKVVCLRRGGNNSNTNNNANNIANTWQYTHSQRSHTHDVFCLALCATATHQRQLPAYHRKRKRTVGDLGILGSTQSLGEAGVLGQYSGYHSGDCLVSGGLDAKLCVYAVQDFARLRPLYLPFLPQGQDAVQHDELYRVVALTQGRHIDLWLTNLQILSQNSNNSNGVSPEYALRVSVKGPEHVSCVALSPCGQLLVCATPPSSSSNNSLHVWQLLQTDNSLSVKQRVSLPATLSVGHVTALRFLPSVDIAATHLQLAVFDGHFQRLYIVQFNKQQQSFVDSDIVASIDCNNNISYDINSSTNSTSNTSSMRSLAAATPRRLQVSPCGKFIAFTSATRYLENHLPGAGHNVTNNPNNNETVALTHSNNNTLASNIIPAGVATQGETQQSLRIVSSHTVTIVDVSRKSVCHRVKALPSAVVDLTFATQQDTSSSVSSALMLLILLQNGSLKSFELSSFRPLSLPCSSLTGHSLTMDVRLPHRLRFPLQHIAAQHTVSSNNKSNIINKMFLYGQMQSVYVDVTQAQPETPRVVQPTYLMTQTQLAHQQALTHDMLLKSKSNNNNNGEDTAVTRHPRVSVLHASVPIGSGYNRNNHSEISNNSTNNEEEEDENQTNGQNKKRKVQFAGGKDTVVAVDSSGDTSQDTHNNNNCALVDVYRNVLHMGFLCVPGVFQSSTSGVSSAKKTNKKSETAKTVSDPPVVSRQLLILVENPWARIAESLPDTMSRKRYGT